jgi:preprotein translocase subunit SecG
VDRDTFFLFWVCVVLFICVLVLHSYNDKKEKGAEQVRNCPGVTVPYE